ncbi:MAG TPA: hypothetical protein VJS69_04985 [Candidatus Krumholzibacteria bacterium]|nr:hypothetical protein [Candidatus Krumholzibacteria bacterium]
MRRIYLLVLMCSLALLSCSDDSTGPPPTSPTTPSPADQSVEQPSSLTLSWSGKGGDHFDVYLGTSTTPPLVAHDLSASHYHPARLTTGSQYYWRVVNVGDSSTQGPLWSFATKPGVPPGEPATIDPADGANVALDPVVLTWSPEPGDSLVFNIYFGSEPDPPLAASDVKASSYNAAVFAGSTYYWRVEAKNLDGLTASSPTRHFQADHAPGHMYNVAGTGTDGFGALDQLPLATKLYNPQDIAFDPAGNLVVVDWNNHRILVVVPETGLFTLVAGTLDGKPGEPCGIYPSPCDEIDAIGAKINHPTSVTVRPDGKMVLSAWHNYSVMLIDPEVSMSRIAGTGKASYDSVVTVANAAPVNLPSASVYTAAGDLIFNDQYNTILRRVDTGGMIHRFAGKAPVWNGTRWVPQQGFSGDEGPALSAKFKWDGTTTCGKLAIDAAGNIYVCDTLNHAIRMIDTAGIIHRFAGLNPASAGFSGDGGPATSAQLDLPRDVACDTHGNVFIADTGNQVIRMVAPDGIITTVAGTPGVSGTSADDGKLATQSTLNLPFGIDIDAHGNLWIADTANSRIRVVYR